MRLAIKRNLSVCWPARPDDRKIVLLYHSVGNSPWAMPLEKFSDQINWLTDHCCVMPLTELIKGDSSKEIQVSITFDDGYVSLYEKVASKLSEKNINATVYVNTGWISENKKSRMPSNASLGHYPAENFLTWPEVRALHQAGWEIGSHGINHYNFLMLRTEVIRKELLQSKEKIEHALSVPCIHFAYPWGRHSSTVKKIAHEVGYHYAAAAHHGPLSKKSDLLAFPRINVSKEYSLGDFKKIIQGKWDYLGILHKIKRL